MVCGIEDRLTASFKGVSFYAVTGGAEYGRRGAEGEFPFGENVAYQDMGRKITVYKLRARFAGPSYIEESAALIRACTSKGPGTLVHPTRGSVQAACRSATLEEDYEEADGVAYIDLEFVEAGQSGFSLSSIAGVAIDSAVSTILGNLGTAWNLTSLPFFAVQDALFFARQALAFGQNALSIAISAAPTFDGVTVLSNLDVAIGDPLALKSGSTLSDLTSQIFGSIDAQASSPQAAFDAHVSIANWAASASAPPTIASQAAALVSSLRTISAAYMARSAQELSYSTLDIALKRIAQVQTIFEEETAIALSSCDDAQHLLLRDLESSTIPALYSQAFLSPPIVTYQLLGSLPSLVAAHEIFGDATQFQTLEEMNPAQPVWAMGPKVRAVKQ